jgi:hypothetical protein
MRYKVCLFVAPASSVLTGLHSRRGIPHAHIACRIKGPQPTSAAEIDAYIKAEIPKTDGCSSLTPEQCLCDRHRLRRIITSSMIHSHWPDRCWKQETPEHLRVCKYGYPFPITPATFIDQQGRVNYMRREAADSMVVSYNEYLCLKYDAHSE